MHYVVVCSPEGYSIVPAYPQYVSHCGGSVFLGSLKVFSLCLFSFFIFILHSGWLPSIDQVVPDPAIQIASPESKQEKGLCTKVRQQNRTCMNRTCQLHFPLISSHSASEKFLLSTLLVTQTSCTPSPPTLNRNFFLKLFLSFVLLFNCKHRFYASSIQSCQLRIRVKSF